MDEPNRSEDTEESHTPGNEASIPDPNAAVQAIAEISHAMRNGKTPRSRRRLKEAVRVLKASGQDGGAAQGLCVLGRLELRSGNAEAAFSAARAALRLVRHNGASAELEETLSLLSRISSRLGDLEQAQNHAQERVRVARELQDAGAAAEALLQLAVSTWSVGDVSRALCLAEDAVEETRSTGMEALAATAEYRLAALLLRAGCAVAANRILSRLLHGREQAPHLTRALLVRGWSWICLGRPDSAARDFRRMSRQAREAGDHRADLEATAALAAAEGLRGSDERAADRSRALAERARRHSRRLRDAELEAAVQGWIAVGAPASDAKETRRSAAQALVELARKTDSLTVANACIQEVERLSALPDGESPYACDPAALPSFEPLGD